MLKFGTYAVYAIDAVFYIILFAASPVLVCIFACFLYSWHIHGTQSSEPLVFVRAIMLVLCSVVPASVYAFVTFNHPVRGGFSYKLLSGIYYERFHGWQAARHTELK